MQTETVPFSERELARLKFARWQTANGYLSEWLTEPEEYHIVSKDRHDYLMRSASRAADLVRVAGPQVLSSELLPEAYDHLWYAYQHANRTTKALDTKRQYKAADVWREKRDMYQRTRAVVWEEMVRRGLRQQATWMKPPLRLGQGDEAR